MENFQQTNITMLQIQELLEAINNPDPKITAPSYIADLHQLENAKRLMELARDFLQETVHDLRAVQDSKQRVIATTTTHKNQRFELADRHIRDTSNARYGWDVIGAALGVSAQAAQSRFTS